MSILYFKLKSNEDLIILFIKFPQRFDEWIFLFGIFFTPRVTTFASCVIICERNGSSEGLKLCVLVMTWCSRSTEFQKKKKKKGMCSADCRYSHLLLWRASSPGALHLAHLKIGTPTQEGHVFSLRLSFWTKRGHVCWECRGTAGHAVLETDSCSLLLIVFNRNYSKFWFDVLLSNT